MGRSVKESLQAVRVLTGMDLPVLPDNQAAKSVCCLGRQFWQALVRGGYQGAAYYLDSLRITND